MVDCPISGGPEAARKAALSVMISGTPADIERLRPLLDTFAGKITVAGEKPGAAQVLKLVNNLIILNSYVGTLEAVVMGRSEERRVGKGCVSKCRSRRAPYH